MEPTEIPNSTPRTSAAAVSSLVCGLLVCIPFVTGLAAVILGIMGLKKTKDPMVKGKGMAIAGLILGVLSLIGSTITTVTIVNGIAVVRQMALMGEPARLVGEEFTRDLGTDKVDDALKLSIEGTDRAKLDDLIKQMKPWGAFQSFTLLSTNLQTDNGKTDCTIGGLATFANGPKAFSMSLKKESEGEKYKVVKLDFP